MLEADRAWLDGVLPAIVGDAAPELERRARGVALSPFSAPETILGETSPRTVFWAELGRLVGAHLQRRWSEGALSLERASELAQELSEHLLATSTPVQ